MPGKGPSGASFATLLLIAWTGGSTDAISYAGLGRVFAANMTGHTVLLALAVSGVDGLSIFRGLFALAAFVAGVAVGWQAIARFATDDRRRRGLRICMLIELPLLILLAAAWLFLSPTVEWQRFPAIALAGLAMGIQSAGVLSLGLSGVSTTYITGLYTQLAANFVDWLRARRLRLANEPSGQSSATLNPSLTTTPSSADAVGAAVRLQLAVLLAYAAGALVGGLSILFFQRFAPFVPLAALALASIVSAKQEDELSAM